MNIDINNIDNIDNENYNDINIKNDDNYKNYKKLEYTIFNFIYNNYNKLVENILYDFFYDISHYKVSYHQKNNYRCLNDTIEIIGFIKQYYSNNNILSFIHNIHQFIKRKVYIRLFKLSIEHNKLCKVIYQNFSKKLYLIDTYINMYLISNNLFEYCQY